MSSYYEDISEDDSILDLIAEADNIPYDQNFDNCVSSFDLNGLHRDEQTQNAGSKIDYKMDSVADEDTGYYFDDYLDVAEEVAISVDEARDDSTGGDSVSVNSESKNERSYNGDDSGEDNVLSDICDDIILEDEPGDSDFSDNDDCQAGDNGHGSDTSDTEDSDSDQLVSDQLVMIQLVVIL